MVKKKSAKQVEANAAGVEVSLSADAAETVASEAEEVVAAVEQPVLAWKVVKTCRVNLFGQPVNLGAGKVLNVASYGEAAIRRLKEQGVELEPV